MAAVGEHEDADAGLELRPQRIELVVDELTVVQHPGLVGAVGFFLAVLVRHLAAVAGVREEQEVAVGELARGFLDRGLDGVCGRLLGQHLGGLEAAALRHCLHVVGVEFARRQGAVPPVVVLLGRHC